MLEILYEDDDLIVLNKPAGLSSQAPPLAGDSLELRARAHRFANDSAGAFLGTAHRLDRPVSGVLVWAKNRRAARIVARQFEQRRVRKEYWAILEGEPPHATIWEDWLVRENTGLGRVQVVAPGTPRAQQARTSVTPLSALALPENTWALSLIPETGRTHQLRVQAAHRGTPIVGDQLYGAVREFLPDTIALHARAITLKHPGDGAMRTFAAPLPVAWEAAGVRFK